MKLSLSAFLQWRLNIFIFKKAGWATTYLYIILLGNLYFFFNRKERGKIIDALTTVYSNRETVTDIRAVIRKVFMGIISHYYEKIFNAFSEAETLRSFFHTQIQCDGICALDEALSKGKGVILITGHLGGVEYIPPYLGTKDYPVSILVRFSSQHLKKRSLQKAEKFSVKIIDVAATSNIMKVIFKDLKENRIVIIQCDEIDEWRPSRKDKIFFLGKQIYPDKTIDVLSRRTDAPLVFAIMQRRGPQRYKFIVKSWEAVAKQFQGPVVISRGAVVLQFFERYIYSNPDEWYQWKKYPFIETVPTSVIHVPAPPVIPLLKPYLGNAA